MANEGEQGNSGGGGFLAGFLAGLALGAALSFLFAPRRSEETGTRLRGKLEELVGQAKAAWEEHKQTASQSGR